MQGTGDVSSRSQAVPEAPRKDTAGGESANAPLPVPAPDEDRVVLTLTVSMIHQGQHWSTSAVYEEGSSPELRAEALAMAYHALRSEFPNPDAVPRPELIVQKPLH